MNFQGKILLGDGTMIVNINNSSYTITREHVCYHKLFEAYKNNDADSFLTLVNEKKATRQYCECTCQDLQVCDDGVYYNGTKLTNAVTNTIMNMMKLDLDFTPMVNFLRRAISSNSSRVVNELFNFIERCGLTITEDGCFLAYKSVDRDYMDKYSRKIDNRVGGTIPKMEKWRVDDNCNNACSHGYHVGALEYSGPGGWYNNSDDHVMICKVAPEDVVSVPLDYNCTKLRTCHYEVIGEFQAVLQPTVYSDKVQPIRSVENDRPDFSLTPDDLLIDEMYTANYCRKTDNVSKTRYFVVLEKTSDYVNVELIEPEENAGDIRKFYLDRLSNIEPYDPWNSGLW